MTKSSFYLTSEAIEDIKHASIWYASQKPDLGNHFQTEVFKAIHTICTSPLAYLSYKKRSKVRRFLMKQFPYKIFYDSSTNPIRIIAIIHTSRSSKYAGKRIK